MKMSQFLDLQLEDIDPSQRVRWIKRLWGIAHGSRVSAAVSAAVAALAALHCVMQTSYLDASLGIRFVTGIFSCVTAQTFYVYRRGGARHTLASMATVARHLEAVAGTPTLVELERVARRCHRLKVIVTVYSTMVVITVILPTLVAGRPSMPVWPYPNSGPALTVVLAAQVVTGVTCPIGFYSLMGFIGATQVACAALYRAAGDVVLSASGDKAVRNCARQHSLLSQASGRLDALTSDIMLYLLAAVMLLPIQGTYDALYGNIDAYLLSSAPIILVVFVPLSYSGQGLSDASEEVGRQAYWGCWPEEGPRARSIRTMMMLRAARPTQFTCRGFGAIGLPACESALKSWFSYLQMLLNLTNKSA